MTAIKELETPAWVHQNPKWIRHRVKLVRVYHRSPANKHFKSLLRKLVAALNWTTTMTMIQSRICLEATLVMKTCSCRWRKIRKVLEIKRKMITTFSKNSCKMTRAKGWRQMLRVLPGPKAGWAKSPGLVRGSSQLRVEPLQEVHPEVEWIRSNSNSLKLPRTGQRKVGYQVRSPGQLLEENRTHITRMTCREFWTPPNKVPMHLQKKTEMTAHLWSCPSFSNQRYFLSRTKILGRSWWRSLSNPWENWTEQTWEVSNLLSKHHQVYAVKGIWAQVNFLN